MKAIVIGATGAVGNDLTRQLLADKDFEQVIAIGRRSTGLRTDVTVPDSGKLIEYVVDFDKPEDWADLVKGDVLFSALGTTLKLAGGQQNQWKVDYTYQLEAAKAAAANGVRKYVLVSSIGAKAESGNFYLRMKGALEEAVKTLPFKEITIIRPQSLIRKNSDRFGEKVGVVLCKIFCAAGPWKAWSPIKTEDVAAEMIRQSKETIDGLQVIYGTDLHNQIG